MLTLHHLENSQSIRILWLLEELGIEYAFKMYDRDPATRLAPSEYKEISPLGTAPAITDGNVTLSESNAIIDYIIETYGDGKLRPKTGTPERADYLFWFHNTQGSLQPLLTNRYVFSMMSGRAPLFIKPIVASISKKLNENFIAPRLERILVQMEAQLAKTKWFAGDELTAADITMGYCVEVMAVRVGLGDRYPHTQRYLEQMRTRPAYQAALKKDGKFKPLA